MACKLNISLNKREYTVYYEFDFDEPKESEMGCARCHNPTPTTSRCSIIIEKIECDGADVSKKSSVWATLDTKLAEALYSNKPLCESCEKYIGKHDQFIANQVST